MPLPFVFLSKDWSCLDMKKFCENKSFFLNYVRHTNILMNFLSLFLIITNVFRMEIVALSKMFYYIAYFLYIWKTCHLLYNCTLDCNQIVKVRFCHFSHGIFTFFSTKIEKILFWCKDIKYWGLSRLHHCQCLFLNDTNLWTPFWWIPPTEVKFFV